MKMAVHRASINQTVINIVRHNAPVDFVTGCLASVNATLANLVLPVTCHVHHLHMDQTA